MRKILSIALSLMLALSLCLFVTACGGDKDLDGVKFESKTVTYNGEEQSIVATNVPEGVTVTYDGNTGTNAGTYNATATFEGEGYKTKTLSATLTIEKANAVIDAQATQRIAYTGQPITVAATLTAGVGDLTYSATPTNVGTYEITVSVAASDNFNAASVKVQLEIYDDSQLPQLELPDLAVTGLEKTYTGSALTPDVAGIPADVTYKFVDASGNAVTMTAVGSYTIYLVASKEGFKDFKSQEYTFVISEAELPQLELPDLAVTGLEKTYTGSALTPDVAGIPSDVTYKFVDASGNELAPMINNGTYTVYIKASKAGFKDFMSDAYTFVIKSSGGLDGIVVEEYQQVVYNGELQKPSFQNVPEDAEIVWLYEDEAIDAGEGYYFEVQFVLGREESDVYYITLDILKADPVFTGETVQTYEANGNLITLQGVSVDNDEQKNSLYFTPADGYTAVGEYTITANVPESINYNAGSKDFTLKIIGLSDEQAKPVFTHADGTPFTETSIEVTFKKSFEWPDLKAMSNTAVEGFDDFTPVDISDKIEVRLLNSTSDYIIGPAWTLLSEAPAYLPSDFRGYTLEIRVTNTIYGGFTTTLTLDVEVLDNPDYEYIQNMVNGETADTDWVLSAGDAYINEYGQPVVGVPAAGQMGTVDFPSVSYAGQKVVNGDIVTTTFNGTTDGVMFHNFGMMFTHDWDKDAPTSGNASWLNFFAFRMEANTTRCYVWMSAGQKEEMPMFGGEIESLMDGRDHTLSMQVTVGRDENGKGIAYVNLWIDTDVSLAPDYTDTITEDMMNSVFNSPERPWPEYMFDAENAGGWVGFGTKRSQKGTGSLTIKGLDIKKPGATDSAMLNPPSLTVDAPEQIYDLNAEVTFGVPAATNLNTYKDLTDRIIVTLYKPDGTPVVLDNTAPKYTLADIGTYKLVYYVKDESGNVSYKEFSFNAIPELATPPTITLDTENREFKSGLNKTFTLPVATGADANGNPLDVTVSVDNIEASPASMSIINNGQITFRAVGEYKITY